MNRSDYPVVWHNWTFCTNNLDILAVLRKHTKSFCVTVGLQKNSIKSKRETTQPLRLSPSWRGYVGIVKAFLIRKVTQERATKIQKQNYKYNEEINRPFPNNLWPLFQSESWCLSFHVKISFSLHVNEN